MNSDYNEILKPEASVTNYSFIPVRLACRCGRAMILTIYECQIMQIRMGSKMMVYASNTVQDKSSDRA